MKTIKLSNRPGSVHKPAARFLGFREKQILNNLISATVTRKDKDYFIVEFAGTWTDGTTRTFDFNYRNNTVTN